MGKKTLAVLGLIIGMSLFLTSQARAEASKIILDPISTYEFNPGNRTTIMLPVGATRAYTNTTYQEHCVISVSGLPDAEYVSTTETETRCAGFIRADGLKYLSQGEYRLTLTASDRLSGAQSIGTQVVRVVYYRPLNAPIIFAPLENHIRLRAGESAQIAVAVSDADNEPLTLFASGLPVPGKKPGIAKFVVNKKLPGYTGGYLALQIFQPGSYTINLFASDQRQMERNTAVAQLHIVVE